jgi:hypothetical protein
LQRKVMPTEGIGLVEMTACFIVPIP